MRTLEDMCRDLIAAYREVCPQVRAGDAPVAAKLGRGQFAAGDPTPHCLGTDAQERADLGNAEVGGIGSDGEFGHITAPASRACNPLQSRPAQLRAPASARGQ